MEMPTMNNGSIGGKLAEAPWSMSWDNANAQH